jgi:hypothetical protein
MSPFCRSLKVSDGGVVMMCKIVLLDFTHRLNDKIIKSQRFESWILFSSSGRKRGKKTENLSVGPPG